MERFALRQVQWHEHDCLGKDDRHHTCRVDFQWDVAACALALGEVRTTGLHLGHLHRHFTQCLNQRHAGTDDNQQEGNLNQEEEHRCVRVDEFLNDGLRERSDDTNHDEQGNTVAHAFVRDALTQPHDDQG